MPWMKLFEKPVLKKRVHLVSLKTGRRQDRSHVDGRTFFVSLSMHHRPAPVKHNLPRDSHPNTDLKQESGKPKPHGQSIAVRVQNNQYVASHDKNYGKPSPGLK